MASLARQASCHIRQVRYVVDSYISIMAASKGLKPVFKLDSPYTSPVWLVSDFAFCFYPSDSPHRPQINEVEQELFVQLLQRCVASTQTFDSADHTACCLQLAAFEQATYLPPKENGARRGEEIKSQRQTTQLIPSLALLLHITQEVPAMINLSSRCLASQSTSPWV